MAQEKKSDGKRLMHLEHGGKNYSYITNYIDEQNEIYNEYV